MLYSTGISLHSQPGYAGNAVLSYLIYFRHIDLTDMQAEFTPDRAVSLAKNEFNLKVQMNLAVLSY